MKPRARTENIHVEKLPNELVIYDRTKHKVHCLNTTVALVWDKADGTRTVDQLAELLRAELGIPEDRSLVLLALEELAKNGLLESKLTVAEHREPSRREVGMKLAMAGLSVSVLPAIASIRSPGPGQSTSHHRDDSGTQNGGNNGGNSGGNNGGGGNGNQH